MFHFQPWETVIICYYFNKMEIAFQKSHGSFSSKRFVTFDLRKFFFVLDMYIIEDIDEL